jgi:EAL domain-containing protein (putative c-di-GMP-specific phosphodiesterase class I)
MVMQDLSSARDVMKKLNGLGVRMAIDDFGTGQSSLAYLSQFPVHEVKVDRSFVQGVGEGQVDSAIVRAVVDLAEAMGILAVAEGVETQDQVTRLTMLGCQIGQGFYFSPPLPAADFDALVTREFANTAGSVTLPANGSHGSELGTVAAAARSPR